MRLKTIQAALVAFFLVVSVGRSQSLGPEIHPDRSITFQLAAPNAESVSLYFGEWEVKPQPMAKGDNGVWSITIGPVGPQLYGYYFSVDGARVVDPGNKNVKIGGTQLYSSLLDVPGTPPRFDQHQNVPHGVIHIVQYNATPRSNIRRRSTSTLLPATLKTLRGGTRCSIFGTGAAIGKGAGVRKAGAGVIADNLIAQGKAEPLIIVMTNGHISPNARGSSSGSTPEAINLLTRELLSDVIPLVDGMFRTIPQRESRAITGLSMGAGQAFTIGLNNLDTFAWIGEFSSGMLSRTPEVQEFDPEKSLAPASA